MFTATYVIVSLLIILGLAVIVGAQASKSSPQDMFADLGTITWDVATVTTSYSNTPGYFNGDACIGFSVPSSDRSSIQTFVIENAAAPITRVGVANRYAPDTTGTTYYSFTTASAFPWNYEATSPEGYATLIAPEGITAPSDYSALRLVPYGLAGSPNFGTAASFSFYFHESVPSNNHLSFCFSSA